MSNKLLLNLLQRKASQQAYGGCCDMEGGVLTAEERKLASLKGKATVARKNQEMMDHINRSYGPDLSRKELQEEKRFYKLDKKEEERINKANRPIRVRTPRDPNAPRKRYARKPNKNEERIQALLRARKGVDICGFSPASLRTKHQDERIANLEAEVSKLTTLQQMKRAKRSGKYKQLLLTHDPAYDNVEEKNNNNEEIQDILANLVNQIADQNEIANQNVAPKKRRGRPSKQTAKVGQGYY